MAKKEDKVLLIKEITKELLELMGTKAEATVSEDKETESVVIDIKSDDETGLLIGSRGDTLNSLQTIIGMIFRNKYGDWQRILVNVSDWRERQEERLKELADQSAERAIETNEPQTLYNLTPAQRRIIHITLSKNKKIETESVGEGRERYLIVKPKKSKKK
jgi:spoIIIJ-associated protein